MCAESVVFCPQRWISVLRYITHPYQFTTTFILLQRATKHHTSLPIYHDIYPTTAGYKTSHILTNLPRHLSYYSGLQNIADPYHLSYYSGLQNITHPYQFTTTFILLQRATKHRRSLPFILPELQNRCLQKASSFLALLCFSWFHTFRKSFSTLSTKECIIFKHPIERVERTITA